MLTPEEVVITKLKQVADNGQIDDLRFEYWVGGGQPPPYYRSEQLRLFAVSGVVQFEFAILRFDSKLPPDGATEKWTMQSDVATFRAISSFLIDRHVFETRYPEETDPGIGGGISHEIIASVGTANIKRTYYRVVPSALAPLTAMLRDRIELTRKTGVRSWMHQGKPIADPFAVKK